MSFSKTMGMRRVVVTGVGMVTSMGLDVPTVWQRLLAGESGITNLDCYTPENKERYRIPDDFPTIGGGIKHFDLKEILQARKKEVTKEDLKQIKYTDRFTQFALAASLEAINDSGVNLEKEDPERAGVIIASGMGGVASWEEGVTKLITEGVRRVSPFLVPKMIPNLAAGNVSISFKAKGPNIALSTACAAGAHAIGMAYRSIQLGEADMMAAGGSEAAVTILTMAAFYRMGALAAGFNDNPAGASRPFDLKRAGFVMSEGSGILALEDLDHALARGAKIYGEIVGFGMTGDAHHITDPDKEGARRCIVLALKDAGLTPAEIDYVNPHATATPVGDRNECTGPQGDLWRVCRQAEGERHQVHDRPPPGRGRGGRGHLFDAGHPGRHHSSHHQPHRGGPRLHRPGHRGQSGPESGGAHRLVQLLRLRRHQRFPGLQAL